MPKRSLQGSVFRSKDGRRWYARIRYTDASGRRREKKRTLPTHAAAKLAIAELQSEIENERPGGDKTFADAVKYFETHYLKSARFVRGQYAGGYRQSLASVSVYLKAAASFFGSRPLCGIAYSDLQEYKRLIEQTPTIHARPRSVADVNHHLKMVRRIFNIAIEQGWLDVSPFKRGGPLINETAAVERTRVLTRSEESALLDNCIGPRRHLRPLIICAVETGMRRGELQKLRWCDVDLTARIIRVEATNTKTLRPRLVPISSRLRSELDSLRAGRIWPASPVFGSVDVKRAFNTACRLAGLAGVHFHDLRHTAITRMLEAGISPPLVMKIAGHSQSKTFMRYVNQTESSIAEIASRLDAAA